MNDKFKDTDQECSGCFCIMARRVTWLSLSEQGESNEGKIRPGLNLALSLTPFSFNSSYLINIMKYSSTMKCSSHTCLIYNSIISTFIYLLLSIDSCKSETSSKSWNFPLQIKHPLLL